MIKVFKRGKSDSKRSGFIFLASTDAKLALDLTLAVSVKGEAESTLTLSDGSASTAAIAMSLILGPLCEATGEVEERKGTAARLALTATGAADSAKRKAARVPVLLSKKGTRAGAAAKLLSAGIGGALRGAEKQTATIQANSAAKIRAFLTLALTGRGCSEPLQAFKGRGETVQTATARAALSATGTALGEIAFEADAVAERRTAFPTSATLEGALNLSTPEASATPAVFRRGLGLPSPLTASAPALTPNAAAFQRDIAPALAQGGIRDALLAAIRARGPTAAITGAAGTTRSGEVPGPANGPLTAFAQKRSARGHGAAAYSPLKAKLYFNINFLRGTAETGAGGCKAASC